MEKDKQASEDQKKKEKETNECRKVANMIGSVIKHSSVLQPKPTANTSPGIIAVSLQNETKGSRRNITSNLNELESESKQKHANSTMNLRRVN